MSGEDKAYAALGLRPGARPADVDEAYRRLIKRYHPDVRGGDGERAAEINRAYTYLRRRGAALSVAPRPRVPDRARERPAARGRRTGWVLVGASAAVLALAIAGEDERGKLAQAVERSPLAWSPPAFPAGGGTDLSPSATFEEPLHLAVIDRAIADALKFHAADDIEASAEFSRACHQRLREDPSLTWFDSCAAFDEATAALVGSSFFQASGPFDSSAVIRRQVGAARLLSSDTLGADSRLRHIRSRVEFAVLPRIDEAAVRQP